MRARLPLVILALLTALPSIAPAAAGPLDPPTHKLLVALVEPSVRNPPTLNLAMAVVPTQDWGNLIIVSFQQKGKRRLLSDGEGSWYIEARHGGIYPSITTNGSQPLPPCPAAVLCSTPTFPPDVEQHVDGATYHFAPTVHGYRYYVFFNDLDAKVSIGPGWRFHYVKGGSLLQYRDTGTGVRISAEWRQYSVEDFHGVAAPRVNGPSLAFASIPCWFPPAPGGSGHAVLSDDGHSSLLRVMSCASYWSSALGASDVPTVWRNEGDSLGWSGGFVNRLVVAVLPPV